MHTAGKSRDRRNGGARSPAPRRRAAEAAAELVDNRPATAQLKKLQQTMDDSYRQPARPPAQAAQLQTGAGTAQRESEEEDRVQGKFDPVQRQEMEEDPVQGRFQVAQREGLDDEDKVQGRFVDGRAPAQLQDSGENRTGMPDALKTGLENLSGFDMSGVRVHYNSARPAQLNALAYAQGNDIHLGPGQSHHLPHEAWHAVQQKQGRVRPTMEANGVAINDDPGLEKEADVMGASALSSSAQRKRIAED